MDILKGEIAEAFSAGLAFISRPRRLIAASIVRIALGAIVAYHYIVYVRLRDFLWGPDGQIPYTSFLQQLRADRDFLNLYAISPSHAFFELTFFTGLAVTIVYMLGWRTRITGVLMFVFTWSLMRRNDELMSGGLQMMLLILFYLMFANVGAYFSIDARRACRERQRNGDEDSLSSRMLAIVHNYAIAMCVIQIVIMYLFSALYKIEGHKWQDGTALYYILRAQDFTFPPLSHFIYENGWLVVLGTYGTLLFQGAFPWLILHRRLKWLVLAAATGFHASIAVLMGLVSFSAVIISIDALLIDDAMYFAIAARVRGAFLRRGDPSSTQRSATAAPRPA